MAVSKILAALFVSMALYEVSVEANVFHVGDSIGWTIGKVNYTLWSETKVFVIGDTISTHLLLLPFFFLLFYLFFSGFCLNLP